MATTKVRSNVYLDKQIFPKGLNIEPIYKDDHDYKIIKNAKKHYKEHSEDYVDFNDVKWD